MIDFSRAKIESGSRCGFSLVNNYNKEQSPETLATFARSWHDSALHLHVIAIASLVREAILDFLHLARVGTEVGIGLGVPDNEAHRWIRHFFRAGGPRATNTVDLFLTGLEGIGRFVLAWLPVRVLGVTFKNTSRIYLVTIVRNTYRDANRSRSGRLR